MFKSKKEKLYISQLLEDPIVRYPAFYVLSASLLKNESLLSAIEAIHQCDFKYYETPKNHEALFNVFASGGFPLYKQTYITGYFGGKVMYLESAGWRSMPLNEDAFSIQNWQI